MTRTVVPFSELQSAFGFVSFDPLMCHEAYLCRDTGAFHYYSELGDNDEELPEDIDDTQRYVALPDKNDLDLGKQLVMRFTDEYFPDAYDRVQAIFSRRGAYGCFKDFLEKRDMLEQWYEYENRACDQALREWCAENDIAVSG